MKNLKIQLQHGNWQNAQASDLHFRGAVFADGKLRRDAQSLHTLLPETDGDVRSWAQALLGLNGFFALIARRGERLVAAVDRVRSIPLFYGENAETICVGDDAEWVRSALGDTQMDPVARDEFSLTGFVSGRQTLYPAVKQILAGEFIVIDRGSVTCAQRYFRYLHSEPESYDKDALRDVLQERAQQAIERLLEYADGRQLVVPLSGGYDSRLLATLLARRGGSNVLTFSYGQPGNKEAAYSSEIAATLGLRWHFVEYSRDHWREGTGQRHQYQKWASGWCVLPHIQDWLAVRNLQRDGIIERNAVFVPGHTCVLRNVGMLSPPTDADRFDHASLLQKILQKHYWRSVGNTGPDRQAPIWKQRIVECGEIEADVSSAADFASVFECWDWQERQAKFISNALRVYEFFGYDWWMPWWDDGMIRFWQQVPVALRVRRLWYIDCVSRAYSAQAGQAALQGSADDMGVGERALRALMTRMPISVGERLKRLHQAFGQRRIKDAYIVSHLPGSEIERLRREGYRLDGMLTHEFLRLARS
jgi:asparagine synthase (glutamine-hydrolysing)